MPGKPFLSNLEVVACLSQCFQRTVWGGFIQVQKEDLRYIASQN